MAKRYILSSEIDRVKRAHPDFELQLPDCERDGVTYQKKVVRLPAAEVLPDDVVAYSVTNPVMGARLLLGDDYPHFLAGGGHASILFSIIQENSKADSMGESGPSSDS
jgi:hypothetical protein